MRGERLLDSAINIPKFTFSGNYLHNDIFEMAAAYAFHIIKNHPFIDGNKRTGITCAGVFLESNDISVKAKRGELYKLGIDIATSKVTKKEVVEFFRSRCVVQ